MENLSAIKEEKIKSDEILTTHKLIMTRLNTDMLHITYDENIIKDVIISYGYLDNLNVCDRNKTYVEFKFKLDIPCNSFTEDNKCDDLELTKQLDSKKLHITLDGNNIDDIISIFGHKICNRLDKNKEYIEFEINLTILFDDLKQLLIQTTS